MSVDDKPIDLAKNSELLSDFVNFDINKKTLLTKLCTALEHTALDGEHYMKTQELLAQIECYIADLAFQFPCDIISTKISVSNILKAVGIEIKNDYTNAMGDLERIIDYMEFVREFDRDKLFITVNLRSFYSDEGTESFIRTCVAHGYKLLMLESQSRSKLPHESRITIDNNLCEF